MTSTDFKNDIKILFFIINSINSLLPGILLFSLGIACATQPVIQLQFAKEFQDYRVPTASTSTTIGYIVGGLITLVVAALGYAGAIRQNRLMLLIYAGLMALGVLIEIVIAALAQSGDITTKFSMITQICLASLGGGLSVLLALKARDRNNQGMILSPPPPPAAYTPAPYSPSPYSPAPYTPVA